MKVIDFEGKLIDDKNKGMLDYAKLNFTISEGSVFGHNKYGYQYLNLDLDSCIKNIIERVNNSVVEGNLELSSIIRSTPGIITVEFKGNDLNLILKS